MCVIAVASFFKLNLFSLQPVRLDMCFVVIVKNVYSKRRYAMTRKTALTIVTKKTIVDVKI